jgi:putative ABC transport system substrate-binding protein
MSTGPVRTLGLPAFFDELRKLGFSEGNNLFVEYRSSNQPAPQMVAAVTELMRSNVDLIVTTGAESHLRAVIEAHQTIPVVMWANNYDPIERGYVKSLSQPGGSVTGVFTRQIDLAEKQLELLTQTFPDRTRLGVLWDEQTADQFRAVERRASTLKLELRAVKLQTQPYDFRAAFRVLAEGSPQMLQVLSGPAFALHAGTISELALQHRIPAMYILRNYVDQGGLMSYGVDMRASFRRVASYVARILSGAKPADLPVEQPTKFELVVNLKTAKAIGLELPTALLLRADEVIE